MTAPGIAVAPTTTSPATTRAPGDLRRLLHLLIVLMATLLIGGSASFLIHLRNVDMDNAAATTAGAVRLLDDHLTRTLTTTDAIVSRMVQVAHNRAHGAISSATEIQELISLEAGLPQRGSILVADAGGRVVAAANPPKGPGEFNLADRDFFKAHAGGAERVIGPMIHGRYNDKIVFTLSRRVAHADGSFAGVVVAGIHTKFFTDFYTTLGLGPSSVIAASTSGAVLLHQPDPERFVGRPAPNPTLLNAAAQQMEGTLLMVSPGDGVERVISFRRLAQFNVVTGVGMAVRDILAPWHRTVLVLSGALAVVLAGLLALAALTFRGLNREERAMESLEATVRARTAEAEQRAEEARRANDSKTRFLAAASHDLRQPLQAAGMFAEVLAGQLESPRQLQVVDKLRQSIEATNSLLATLLDVSALEAGKIKPNAVTFRLMPLLAGLVDQVEPEASAKGLAIGAVPTSVQVVSDPVLLERLLRNLLVNAVRYTGEGRILVGCRHRGDHVAIEVHDTGIGIPADKAEAVFEDFVRLDTPAERGGSRGLGLGLGVVRRMAQLLGHTLELRSVPAKGSCFRVVVPKG